jgi:hypothetical protein
MFESVAIFPCRTQERSQLGTTTAGLNLEATSVSFLQQPSSARRNSMRTCLFCGGNPSTKEDAWPLWLMKRFPSASTARMFAERRGGPLSDWPITKPKLPVKWLCASCNNGWMSRLEREVKPIIESILDEKLNAIDASAQQTLAAWAVKTVMVLEALDPDRQWFYTAEEREQMRLSRSIPHRTSVWIAKCIDHKDIYSAAKNHSSDDGARAFSVTMAFGLLAFQVETVRAPQSIPAHVAVTYEVSDGPWDQLLVAVGPVSQAARTWPAAQGLNGDVGLIALTERLNPPLRACEAPKKT